MRLVETDCLPTSKSKKKIKNKNSKIPCFRLGWHANFERLGKSVLLFTLREKPLELYSMK